MNIFILNDTPMKCAADLCDQHVVKMPIETAQMLCAAFYELGSKFSPPYKKTHVNHPCTVWARETKENYKWLVKYGLEICYEYSYRYGGKVHKSQGVIEWCRDNIDSLEFLAGRGGMTEFVLAMPEEYKLGSVIDSYRNYYINDKLSFAKWKRVKKPKWLLDKQ